MLLCAVFQRSRCMCDSLGPVPICAVFSCFRSMLINTQLPQGHCGGRAENQKRPSQVPLDPDGEAVGGFFEGGGSWLMQTSPGWLFRLFRRRQCGVFNANPCFSSHSAYMACSRTRPDQPPASVLAFVYSPVPHSPLSCLHLPLNSTAKTSPHKKKERKWETCFCACLADR